MAVRIARELHDALIVAASASPHAEICGLLLGEDGRIAEVRPCANVAMHPARTFEIEPAALIAAHKAARAGGPQVVGDYHSHPNGLCAPSTTDIAAGTADGSLMLIVAAGRIGAWRRERDGSLAEIALLLSER